MTSITTEPLTYGSQQLAELIEKIGEGALERERTGERPFAVIDLIKESGLGALRVPRAEGGGGATLRELFATVIAIAEVDVNVAHILRGHFAHIEERLRVDGEVRRQGIDLALSGKLIGNASTEIGSTPAGGFTWQTTLTPDGEDYLLNGKKFFTTGTLYSDYAEVLASDPTGASVIVLVPTDHPGVTVLDDWDGMGQRATGTGTAIFENVPVRAAEVMEFAPPGADDEEQSLYLSGAFFQLYVTALEVGVIHALRKDAVAHVHSRTRSFAWAPNPVPADDPLLQREIGEIAAAAYAGQATVLAAADALAAAFEADVHKTDPDLELAHEASLQAASAKIVVDALAQKAASQIFDVGGASIVRQVHLLDRHWRNIRTLASHNPSSYKAQAIGALYARGTKLPGSGYF
ncbi:acyl-CoA dehydrogenase family protein [Mycolicibacterium diernhoferi]|uniref:Dibenzothiophene monooxygenase n=1 Tax=Mycolicibacterium diernhoferi TaxID=1801 RepID=A0A1Q4HHY5_9MYCO|nr:acyl-CoA dehydrogenase family protein [Mycolicibacterium diernhoferi]OJZ67072.1 acyl-CoA dehydrogenase [Mycolicibacterium diernhoferi]OPE56319.1 acyl-CoA dehydrogenase [Mycolicibacterium diernhoferi]PEG53706.1 acyl-CoA dehydrogenase [Mycolicibacterium diernhoferi]QYL23268.1 acyl-CoA dehydrogenase family protein [Mycolicibacterium diernhoferi]